MTLLGHAKTPGDRMPKSGAMMVTAVKAVFEDGVFKPKEPVKLEEHGVGRVYRFLRVVASACHVGLISVCRRNSAASLPLPAGPPRSRYT